MTVITLLTNYGPSDSYISEIKGKILSITSNVHIVDVSHHFSFSYHMHEAIYLLKTSYKSFPSNTIHIVGVQEHNPEPNSEMYNIVLVKADDNFFIIPDNGIINSVFNFEQIEFVLKIELENHPFPILKAIEKIESLINRLEFSTIGIPYEFKTASLNIEAGLFKDRIDGKVIHIDCFGNLITNIQLSDFENISKNRQFEIRFGRLKVNKIFESYTFSSLAEEICLWNHHNHLEIAMNSGSANKLLGLEILDHVQIIFFN